MKEKVEDVTHEIKESVQKVWLAGLGALAVAEEEGSRVFRSLVERGEAFEERRREEIEKVRANVDEALEGAKDRVAGVRDRAGGSFDAKVAETLNRMGVPNRSEIQALTRRVEKLTESIDRLREAQ